MGTIEQFKTYLIQEEKSPLTVEKYLRDVRFFLKWLNGRMIIKAEVLSYKEALMESYAVASVNSMLSSLNCYLNFIGRADCQVKTIKQQRRTFCAAEKELTKQECCV